LSLGENEIAENGGEWIGGMGPAKGRPAIQKMMETSIGNGSRGSNRHLFTNETIDVRGAWKFHRRLAYGDIPRGDPKTN
jgi:hypothetical protein